MSNKILKLHFGLFLLLAVLLSGQGNAQSKSQYYENYLASRGLLYKVVLSSDLNFYGGSLFELPAKNASLVLICDDSYEVKDTLFCSGEDIKSLDESVVVSNFEKNLQLIVFERFGTTYFVFPEKYFYSASYRELAVHYLDDSRRSTTVGESKTTVTADVKLDEKLSEQFLLPEFLHVAGFMAIAFFVLAALYKTFDATEGKLKKLFNKKTLEPLSKFFGYQKNFSLYILVVITLLYIPIISILSLKDTGKFSLEYFLTYSLETFTVVSKGVYSGGDNIFRIILFFYNFSFLIILLLVLLPTIMGTLSRILDSRNAKPKKDFAKYAALFAILAIPPLVIMYGIDITVVEITFLVIVLTYMVLASHKRGLEINRLFSSKEKAFAIILFFVFVLGGGYLKLGKIERLDNSLTEKLFQLTSEFVILPYMGNVPEHGYFKDYLYKDTSPIFVDDSLIYYPGATKVINKNLGDFKDQGNYIVIGSDGGDTIEAVLKSPKLKALLSTQGITNFFGIENLEVDRKNPVFFELSVDCKQISFPSEISLEFYTYNDFDGSIDDSEDVEVLNFPGCPVDSTSPYQLIVPVSPEHFTKNLLGIKAKGFDLVTISKLSIYQGDNVPRINFYKDVSDREIILSNIGEGVEVGKPVKGDITLYSADIDDTFVLDSDKNISGTLNKLIKEGLVKDDFVIWSPAKISLPVNNDDSEKP